MSRFTLMICVVAAVLFSFIFFKTFHNQPSLNSGLKEPSSLSDATPLNKWREYVSPSGIFTVLFPSLPQHANEVLKDPKTKETKDYDVYISEDDNGDLFMINIIASAQNAKPIVEELALNQLVEDMIALTPNSKLKERREEGFQNRKAIYFSIEKDQANVEGIAFFFEKKLIVLSSVSKNPLQSEKKFDFFIHSFKLLSEKPTTLLK